ncbi:unnamed protein product [Meloidogyne enterolobii]|uniref:Uncharacterized protein n=1 Tax=Meloidogyne enterolobii TaxID=390850 RepID=A0ACB0Y290_MELEN
MEWLHFLREPWKSKRPIINCSRIILELVKLLLKAISSCSTTKRKASRRGMVAKWTCSPTFRT